MKQYRVTLVVEMMPMDDTPEHLEDEFWYMCRNYIEEFRIEQISPINGNSAKDSNLVSGNDEREEKKSLEVGKSLW